MLFRIQYAKVVRWKPPIDLASEMFPNSSFDGTSFGSCCPQPRNDNTRIEHEQCLYLNIYKPLVPSNHSLLPVFVWIHGGAHKKGCSAGTLFNGTHMIARSSPDQPVIIVTINYRLGVFADMYLKELIEEDSEWPTAGNCMYLDMLSALRWIQKNIRDYGGDPNTVSLFGQSAGGLSVTDLGAVRGSTNLYRTALSQSGTTSPGSYEAYYNMSNALNYSNDDKQKLLECIRNASIDALMQLYDDRYTRPIIDNHFFPLYPPLAILNGTYNNITLIMGHNDYEETICTQYPDMNFTKALILVNQSIGNVWTPFVADYYHLNTCSPYRTANNTRCCDIIRLILSDKRYDCDIRRIFDAFYSTYDAEFENNKLFSYHLNCYPRCAASPYEDVCRHSSELPYVFGFGHDSDLQPQCNATWDSETEIFSNKIIAHWINIATTGRPLNEWPSYNPSVSKNFYITPDQDFSAEIWNRNCTFFNEIEAEVMRKTLLKTYNY